MNVQSNSQQSASSDSQALIPTKPIVVRTQELADRYTFDDVLAMQFGIENGTQLIIRGKESQKLFEFAQPLRIAQQDRNYPLSIV